MMGEFALAPGAVCPFTRGAHVYRDSAMLINALPGFHWLQSVRCACGDTKVGPPWDEVTSEQRAGIADRMARRATHEATLAALRKP